MTPAHVQQVVQIESAVSDRPWSAAMFRSELDQADRWYLTAWSLNQPAGQPADQVVGYGGAMRMLNEAHITNLAVAPAWQRRAVGSHLLLALLDRLLRSGVAAATLEVRASNLPAQRLYGRFGFAPVGVRRGYYPASAEDAIIMWAHDIDRADYRERLQAERERLSVLAGQVSR